MTGDSDKLLQLMEYIEASGVSGASFDDKAERLNAMYPNSPQYTDKAEAKVGMSISERDHYLSMLRKERLVDGIFTKDGIDSLKLTLRGQEYLENKRKAEKLEKQAQRENKTSIAGVLGVFAKYFVLPVCVIVAAALVLIGLGVSR